MEFLLLGTPFLAAQEPAELDRLMNALESDSAPAREQVLPKIKVRIRKPMKESFDLTPEIGSK